MNKEFFEAVRLLEKEKGVPAALLCERIQQALIVALRNDYNKKEVVFCEINADEETMRVWLRKNVVDEIEDEDTDILVEEAQRYQSSAKAGDIIEIEMESKEFSRVAAQTAKHVIRQGIKDAERGQVIKDFQSKTKDLVTAKVSRIDPVTGNVTLEIGKGTAVLPKGEQVPGETYKVNDRLKVFIMDVKKSNKGPQVFLSRSHPGLVKRLFELEVPEIEDGTVEIRGIAREAGSRTKMAVYTEFENVDPVGSCVGTRGARVQAIVDELNGEKIDIIPWSEDPAELIANVLSPAKVEKVIIDSEEEKMATVVVPDYQLSLAIGKEGQNVRLAARVSGWKIDIKSHSQFAANADLVEIEEEAEEAIETAAEFVELED